MPKRKFRLPNDIDWRMVEVWRRKGEAWKKISARTRISAYSLRRWAERLGKIELLAGRQVSRSATDWFLVIKLYREGKSLDMIAAEAGFANARSLTACITQRRKDGRWNLPKRPLQRSVALR